MKREDIPTPICDAFRRIGYTHGDTPFTTMEMLEKDNHELKEALLEACEHCACSLRERESGHSVNCWVPGTNAILERLDK